MTKRASREISEILPHRFPFSSLLSLSLYIYIFLSCLISLYLLLFRLDQRTRQTSDFSARRSNNKRKKNKKKKKNEKVEKGQFLIIVRRDSWVPWNMESCGTWKLHVKRACSSCIYVRMYARAYVLVTLEDTETQKTKGNRGGCSRGPR